MGHGGMGEEEPRREKPRAESAGMPREMGAWVFMARKACTTPFPALKPNPSRSFLSGGRGDYPITNIKKNLTE